MIDTFARFAISWVPQPGSPLARFGASWTGWCLDAAERRARRSPARLPFAPEQVTGPIEYQGLQAVICAPFRFRTGRSVWLFERELAALTDDLEPFMLPRLSVAVVDGRIVLAPPATTPALARFVTTIRQRVAPFDAAADDRVAPVAPATDTPAAGPALVLPLTRRLAPEEAEALARPLARELEPILAERQQIADFALLGDPGGGRALRVIERHSLAERSARIETSALSCTGPQLFSGLGPRAIH